MCPEIEEDQKTLVDLVIENCKFPRCRKKTSVGKTANMWVFGQKNVIFSNSSFNSSDMPQTLSTAVTRHQRPWATWDDQWRSGEKLRKIQEFQGSLPTNCHYFQAHIYINLEALHIRHRLASFPTYIYNITFANHTETIDTRSHKSPPSSP